MTVEEVTGEVVARAVLRRANRGAFGILLRELPEDSFESFIATLGAEGGRPLRVRLAIPCGTTNRATEIRRLGRKAGFPENSLETSVEAAEVWRNDVDVTETIVVVALKELPKLRGLNRFQNVGANEIYDEVCTEAREKLGVNAPLQHLWSALQRKSVALVVPYEGLLAFYAELSSCPKNALPTKSRDLLRLIGLLPDPKLYVSPNAPKIAERLLRNAKTVDQIEVLSRADRQRISKALATRSEKEREELRETYRRVMAFHRDQNPALLEGLTVDDVEKLLRVKQVSGDGTGGGTGGSGGDTPEVEPAARAIDCLLEGRTEELESLGETVREAIESHDGKDAADVRDPESGETLKITYDHPFMRVVDRCISAEKWGGLFEVDAPTLDAALTAIEKMEPRPFDPEGEWAVRDNLQSLIASVGIDPGILVAWDGFVAARRALAKHLRVLQIEPLLQIGSTKEYFATADGYLAAYGRLLEGLRQSYEAIAKEAPDGVEMLCSQILALDTIVIRSASGYRAILSPLHPLHLWKFVELIRQARAEAGRFSDLEKDLLRKKVGDLPNFVTTLYLSGYITQSGPRILPEAGTRGGLPYFEEFAHKYAGRDGVPELLRLLERFCVLYPHGRFGLRIALIDPPELDYVLRELVRLAERMGDMLEALHVRVFFTGDVAPSVAALGGGAKDEEGAERFRGFDGSNRFTLEIHDQPEAVASIAARLRDHPAHVAVLFDPSSAKTLRLHRTPSLRVHPLCLPMQFQYDRITHVVRVVPASDGGIFSDHNDLRARLSRQLTGSFFAVSSDLKAQQRDLAALAGGCTWLAIADRAQEGALQIDVPRVALQRAGKRDVAVYAMNLGKFLVELDRQLRSCNYAPSQAALNHLVEELETLLSDGLLSLVGAIANGAALDERRTRGLLGVLVAAAWYREQASRSLLVSIDSPEAKRWLELREDDSRADLLGLVDEEDGSFTIDLIEVKTYEHPEDAYRIDGDELAGEAVDQVLNTARIVGEVFELDPTQQRVVSPQRREILRQQLFRECFFERRTEEERIRWKDRLNELFALNTTVKLRLSLIVVGLTHVHGPRVRTFRAGGRAIRLIELAEDDVRRYVTGEPVAAAQSAAGTATVPAASHGEEAGSGADRTASEAPAGQDGASTQGIVEGETAVAGNAEERRIRELAAALRRVLRDHAVSVLDVDPDLVQRGPSVLRFRVKLGPGARVQTLRARAEDIGRELACRSTPLIDNLPGEQYVSVDLERPVHQTVLLEGALQNLPQPEGLTLPVAVGVTPDGESVTLDLVQLPHLLVAGSTMSGKTVFLHAVILSLLSRLTPASLELVLIDPKATDFVFYNGLPSLRGGRVITEATDAIHLLQALIAEDLTKRTRILQDARCPNVLDYNRSHPKSALRLIVVVIDEYADLVAVLNKADRQTFERDINRLAQRARSVGIHLVLATQRPTTDVVTGLLKANMPCRVSFRLPQQVDSRVILDQSGAENLFGQGDMLLFRNDRVTRLQGYFISPTSIQALLPSLPGAQGRRPK